jgi:hypothetical protein
MPAADRLQTLHNVLERRPMRRIMRRWRGRKEHPSVVDQYDGSLIERRDSVELDEQRTLIGLASRLRAAPMRVQPEDHAALG